MGSVKSPPMTNRKDNDTKKRFITEEQEEDEFLPATPKIDVKKDISINQAIKTNSKSFSESYNNYMSDSKASIQKVESNKLKEYQRQSMQLAGILNAGKENNDSKG